MRKMLATTSSIETGELAMKALTACLVISMAFGLLGCASAVPTSEGPSSPMATTGSASSTVTVDYGVSDEDLSGFVASSYGTGFVSAQMVPRDSTSSLLRVVLSAEDVTGTAPFVSLEYLARTYDAKREYLVYHALPMHAAPGRHPAGRSVLYVWRPAARTVTRYEGIYDMRFSSESPVGRLSRVSRSDITHFASGARPIPAFVK
jgi:hypothetical protein